MVVPTTKRAFGIADYATRSLGLVANTNYATNVANGGTNGIISSVLTLIFDSKFLNKLRILVIGSIWIVSFGVHH